MKNFKLNIAWLIIFALVLTSCSKEEAGVGLESEKATLSFGAVITDLVAKEQASKQAVGNMPVCSDDTPAYVKIVLLQGDEEIVGTADEPYTVSLVTGEIFTVDDPKLELEPGIYTLSHFSVYNDEDDLLWLAPREGALANYVEETLPLTIDLRAGVKKYVDVSVLCYDNRNINLYGYLFFEFDTIEAAEFCFFANYCDVDGKHFPARYTLDLWEGTDASGNQIYDGLENTVGINEDGDFFASALCVAVPVNGELNEEYLYYRLTILDWEDNYGDITETVIAGTLSRADIEANFREGNAVEYEHFRFGCGNDDEEPAPDADEDGVPDSIDQCEDTPAGTDVNAVGCPEDRDTDGDGVLDSIDECANTPAGTDVDAVGCPEDIDTDGDGVLDSIDECDDVDGPASNNGCPEGTPCDQTNATADCDNDGTANECDEDNPNYATFDCDNDGVLNGRDKCPVTAVSSGQVDPDGDGCWTDPVIEECVNEAPCNIDDVAFPCVTGFTDADGDFLAFSTAVEDLLVQHPQTGQVIGYVDSYFENGELVISLSPIEDFAISGYVIEVVPATPSGGMSTSCREFACNSSSPGDLATESFENISPDETYYLKVKAVICAPVIP